MPTPQEFMERVVPWPGSEDDPGYVNCHWTSDKSPGIRGRPFKNIQEFMSFVHWGTAHPGTMKDIYFCTSLQAATGKVYGGNKVAAARHAATALSLKAVWLDVDVKPEKGYPTIPLALDAVTHFVQGARLPAPSAIVLSGGGLHIYWISEVPLHLSEWQPYANGLKAEAMRLGLKCDYGVTGDAARILRVPGTFNCKTTPPRAVKVVHLGQSYNFAVGLGHLAAIAPVRTVTGSVTSQPLHNFDLSKFPPKPRVPGQDSLADGIREDRPLDPAGIFKNCAHFAEAVATEGKNMGQGTWMLNVLAATFFKDGRDWAHKMSRGYPTYSEEETDKMWERKVNDRADGKIGWPGCHAFEGDGCKHCATCVFKGKIKSPLNLAERLPQFTAPPPPPDNLMLPPGFTVNPEGIICEMIQEVLSNGVENPKLAPLFMCKLRNPQALQNPAALRFECSLDKGKWGNVTIQEADTWSEQQIMKVLCAQQVKVYRPNQRRIANFMTSWLAKLDDELNRQSAAPFGWVIEPNTKAREGFVYGGRYIKADGTTVGAGFCDPRLAPDYTPTGSIEPWFEALKVVTDQKCADIETIIATSFAAPLMISTGEYNGMFCAWSPEAGTHKTTSLSIAAAVWGNPQRTKENTKSSVVGVMRRLGYIRNLPIYWDEISTEQKMEAVQDFLSVATEGGGGTKLKQDRTMSEREEWQSLICIGSNRSLWDHLEKKVKNTDAQLQRIFEIGVIKRPDSHNPLEVARLIRSLDNNFGHMGLRYADFIGKNPVKIDTFVKSICQAFNTEVGMRSEERFRAAMAATTFAGAALANQLGATFNLGLLYNYIREQFLAQRERLLQTAAVGGSAVNTSEAMTKFFKAVVKNTLWVKTMPVAKGKPAPVVHIAGPSRMHPEPIHVRCSVDDRLIHLSKDKLTSFLIQEHHSVSAVLRGLEKHFNATSLKRISLTAGAGLSGGRETVIEIPVPPGSEFEDVLFAHTPVNERPGPAAPPTPENPSGPTGPVQEAA